MHHPAPSSPNHLHRSHLHQSSPKSPPVPTVCDALCAAERRVHTRELAKWGRKVVMLVGLENVFQRALGPGQWRRFSRAVKVSASHSSTNFELDHYKDCNWCFGSRQKSLLGPESLLATMNEALLNGFGSAHRLLPPPLAPHMRSSPSTLPGRSSPPSASSTSSSCSPSSAQLPPHPPDSPKIPSSSSVSVPGCDAAPLPSPSPMDNPFARFLSAHYQQQQANLSASGGAERMVMAAAAAMNFFNAATSVASATSGTGSAVFPHPSAAFLPAAFLSGFCPWPPFVPAHAASALAATTPPNLLGSLPHLPLTSNGSSSSSSSSSPNTSFPNILDLQQQLAMAWHSQLFALSLMSSFNGFCPPPATSAARDQLPSEDEALAFLAAFNNNSDGPKSPPNNGQDQQPLDLTKSGPRRTSSTPKNGKETESMGTKKTDEPEELDPDQDEQMDMEDMGGGEDGSEAESPKLGVKRNYTMDDLDAAVTAIRNGRLGTRRASVVYGIPRSTLRNKIYKLEAAEDNGDGSCKRRRLTAFALHKREQRLAAQQKVTTEGTGAANSPFESSGGGGRNSATVHVDGPLEGTKSATVSPVAGMMGGGEDSSTLMGTAPSLLRQNSMPTFPLLGTNSAEQLLREFSSLVQNQQAKSQSVVGLGEGGNLTTKMEGNPTGERAGEKPKGTKAKKNKEKEKGRENGGSTSRPKRGQYRKYEKEALDKAVAAVRSNQMSVHKAGTLFGVPHSTLEYKVKERNLLRTKSKKALLNGGGGCTDGMGIGGGTEQEVRDTVESMLNVIDRISNVASGRVTEF